MWLYPTRQTLASVLIRKADVVGRETKERQAALADAKRLLRESLGELAIPGPKNGVYRGNGWAYYGLLEIANRDSATDVSQATLDLKTHWFGSLDFRSLDRM